MLGGFLAFGTGFSIEDVMNPDLVRKYDLRVPRYTSYPTAPHFHPGVDGATYHGWLTELDPGQRLSLYLHVPFCAEMCWFCGCLTKITKRYAPIAAFVDDLLGEIDRVADALPGRLAVGHVHWGGGSPTALSSEDFERVVTRLQARFAFQPGLEHAVELDPRTADQTYIETLARCGVTRASIGVQDFDPEVQAVVNRRQPAAVTEQVVAWLRAAGVPEINIDLMYGLPRQTVPGVERTVDHALSLTPRRIALFGYAHVPWMKKHQRLLPEDELPDADTRWAQYLAAERRLTDAGFTAIGLDHYAAPGDAMADALHEGRLHRNFQGYTTDAEPVLLGFGTSAIGVLPQGYVQNHHHTHQWRDALRAGGLPTARGIAVSAEDRFRRAIIEQVMCHMTVDLAAVATAHGRAVEDLTPEVESLAPLEADGVMVRDGWRLTVTEDGRALVRLVAAAFDQYLQEGEQRHSRAV